MSERVSRAFFVALAAAMLALLIAAPAWRSEAKRPENAKALAAWIESHPADSAAAAALTEGALDTDIPRRFDLWRSAHRHAEALDPQRPDAKVAFVRSAFFHWYELDDRDKKLALQEAAPLMRDPHVFHSMAPPMWRLTHDFGFLHRAAGDSYSSLALLRDIAATNGLFNEYRSLSAEAKRALVNQFKSRSSENDPTEFILRELTTDDQALVEAMLAAFHDDPLDKHPSNPPGAERLVDYAIRHAAGPLDGLEFLVRDASISAPTRARLAIALGDAKQANLIETGAGTDNSAVWSDYYAERAAYERAHGDASVVASYLSRAAASRKQRVEWSGLCGDAVCTSAHKTIVIEQPRAYEITLQRTSGDEVPPYVEVYADDARFGEGAIAGEQSFTTTPLTPGEHRIDVRIVNPFTRNLEQRRVKVVRESAS